MVAELFLGPGPFYYPQGHGPVSPSWLASLSEVVLLTTADKKHNSYQRLSPTTPAVGVTTHGVTLPSEQEELHLGEIAADIRGFRDPPVIFP